MRSGGRIQLPSPISRDGHEIYNYSVKPDGFYLIDQLVDSKTAGEALKIFVDEVLKYCQTVEISEA